MATLSNYRLDGFCNSILDFVYENDLATTKSDALRSAIKEYGKKVGAPEERDYLEKVALTRKLKEFEDGVRSGKIKPISEKEFVKMHPEAKAYLG